MFGAFVVEVGVFRDAFPSRGKSALSPAGLALVSVLQFAEGLADRQAPDAVRARIDWKYALGLELTDPGFDYSVLWRTRSASTATATARSSTACRHREPASGSHLPNRSARTASVS
jgi:hypothetical protein